MRTGKFKRTMMLGLASTMAASMLLSGCEMGSLGKDKEVTEVADDAIEVSSLEDFIEAIEPGANIVFKKGTYNFTPELEDLYGDDGKKFNKKHEYVQILECFDGVELVIQDIEGLTIQGQEGKKVELQVEPRYADVIRFEECKDISISNMTVGHTVEQGSCAGDVLEFDDCENISLDGMDLYGCGTYAVTSYRTSGIAVTDSTLRDCSYGLIDISESSDVSFKSCDMTGSTGYTMLSIYSSDVTFSKCTFEDNTCDDGFVTFSSKNNVSFKGCTFGAVESSYVNFGELDSDETGVSFDSKCSFDDSLPSAAGGSSDGITSVTIDGEIDTVGEILESIEPGAYVIISDGYYNLTEFIDTLDVDGYNACHDYVQLEEVYDGYQVVIQNCSDLEIISLAFDNSKVEIVTDPRYAAVFKFNNCEAVGVSHVTLGHTDRGDCSGPVIELDSTTDFSTWGADLYGCGVYGIESYNSGDIYVEDSTIRDCSFGPFNLLELTGEVTFDGCTLTGSDGMGYIQPSQYFVRFQNCTIGDMETYEVLTAPNVTFTNCVFEGEYPENGYGEADEANYTKCTFADYIDANDYYTDNNVFGFGGFCMYDADGETFLLPFYSDEYDEYVYVHMIISADGQGSIIGMTGMDIINFTFDEDDINDDVLECDITEMEGYEFLDSKCQLEFYQEDEYTYLVKLTFMDMEIWYL